MSLAVTTLVVGAGLPTFSDLPALVVPGRRCGTCSLCCKLPPVLELHKPRSVLCANCVPGSGCGIHATRPAACREFFCNWLLLETLGPEWKPERCHFMLQSTAHAQGHQGLTIWIDHEHPDAWRALPYSEQIRKWVDKAWNASRDAQGPIYYVTSYINGRVSLLLPEREVEVGTIETADAIVLNRRVTSAGMELTAQVVAGGAANAA